MGNNGITAPLLCCDICDAPSDDAKEGASVFPLAANGMSSEEAMVFFMAFSFETLSSY